MADLAPPGDRHAGLDRLKAGLTLLVVFHHTAITYGAIGGWFYRERQPDGSLSSWLLILFCTLNQAWFMGLFFLLAGYFTPRALQRKSARTFVRDRLLRLGLPLLAFGLLLGPLTISLAQYVLHDRAVADVFAALWRQRQFENGPLWFTQALLIFSGVALVWHRLRARAPEQALAFPSNTALLLAALVCGGTAFLLRLWWPIGRQGWGLQIGYFAGYVILFAAGCVASQRGWLDQMTAATLQVRQWKLIAGLSLIVLALPTLLERQVPAFAANPAGGWNMHALLHALWEPFFAWGVILVMLLRAMRSGATPSSALWRRLSRRAYCIYVIHPLPVVAVALAWRDVPAPALLKFAVTGSVACAACYLVAGWLLRVPAIRRVL